ncbi:MAG TPA: metallophosphoesterase [Candidatus Kapabacteria bacterium]|nr:metallophosphoesterase [Candidatus Kapabacteria bacterium]
MSSFLIFIIVMTLLYIVLDTYFISKLAKIAKQRKWNKWVVRSLWISSAASLFFLILIFSQRILHTFDKEILVNITKILTIWYLPKILIFLVAFPIDIIRFVKNIFLKLFKKNTTNTITQVVSSRRKFVQNTALSVAGIPFYLAVKGVAYNVSNVRVYRENIYLKDLPINLNDFKIVQISDLHLGSFPDKTAIIEMCHLIQSLNPDIIFITGDFVNFDVNELDMGLEEVSKLKSKYGIYAILGNHDHYMTDNEHQKLIKRIKESGISLLINENVILNINNEKINLVGVDNEGSKQKFADWEKAYKGIDKRNKTILLCHDPSNWDSNIIDKYPADLTLSGHTHGGQIALSFMGLELSPAQLIYKEYAGLYTNDDKQLYVNRGIGTSGPPMRLSMDPEVSLLILKLENNIA